MLLALLYGTVVSATLPVCKNLSFDSVQAFLNASKPSRRFKKVNVTDTSTTMNTTDLIHKYSDFPVNTKTIHFVQQCYKNNDGPRMTIKQYFKHDFHYGVFEPQPLMNLPSPEKFKFGLSILSLGKHGDGVPFHTHGKSNLLLLNGYKLWFIYAPKTMPRGMMNTIGFRSSNFFFESILPNLQKDQWPQIIFQRPGEIVSLPRYFHHMTLNIGNTIGVANLEEVHNGSGPRDPQSVIWCTLEQKKRSNYCHSGNRFYLPAYQFEDEGIRKVWELLKTEDQQGRCHRCFKIWSWFAQLVPDDPEYGPKAEKEVGKVLKENPEYIPAIQAMEKFGNDVSDFKQKVLDKFPLTEF